MRRAGTGFRWKAALFALGAVILLPLLAALSWLKWHEADLIFQNARTQSVRGFAELPPRFVQGAQIPLRSGEHLQAFTLTPDPERDNGFWILHLHGNADTAFSRSQFSHVEALRARGFHVLSFDYRGFGASPGTASENHIHEDSEAAFEWLGSQGVPANKVILWGHSLGSGPAVDLASRHQVAGLVLFGAFTSVDDMAAGIYPWLPVRWIVGVHFNNLQRIRAVHVPVVIVHSVTDRTIPFSHAESLYAAANEPKRLLKLQELLEDGLGRGHYSALYEQLDLLMPVLREMMRVGE